MPTSPTHDNCITLCERKLILLPPGNSREKRINMGQKNEFHKLFHSQVALTTCGPLSLSVSFYHSRFMACGASAKPFTLSRSAVFKNAGSCSWETLTSPAYMNSRMDVRWLKGTSFKMIMGCFDGFSSRSVLKYGLHADRTILCALHVCPSHAKVTSVKLFSSRKCLKDETMLDWKSFHFRKNCCCSCAMMSLN